MILLSVAVAPAGASAPPAINAVNQGSGGSVVLLGRFGPACRGCEVLAHYRNGVVYALSVESWEPGRIVAGVPDLNVPEQTVSLQVRNSAGASSLKPTQLVRRFVPSREHLRPVSNTSLDNRHFFERHHALAVGDKGEDRFELSSRPPACHRDSEVFDHAVVIYKDRRFGEARIVESPPAGCVLCPPLKVRWYHEPTGKLTYQLHVYYRLVQGVCPERKR